MEMLLDIPTSGLLVPNDIQPNVTDNTEDTYSTLLDGRFALCSLPLRLANYVWKAALNKHLQIMSVAGTWNNVGWSDTQDCSHMTAITQRYILFIVINISPLVLQKYHPCCTPVRHWLCLRPWSRDFSTWYMLHINESLGPEQWWFSAASHQVAQLESFLNWNL